MAADSDSEDPMRILAGFMNSTAEGEGEAQLNVSDILRHLDEQWRRELRESQTQEDGDRPHRYLPPLSYPSSSSSLSSSRSDSPSSPMFFPSPPSDARPLPPQMTRQYAQSGTFLPAAEPSDDLAFHFDEELAQVERVDLIRRLERTESLSAPLSDPVPIPTESSIPISQTPPRAIHRTPNSLGYDVGLDMSPPPSVSPRLYNWSRSRSESHLRRDPVSASPTRFLGRSGSVRGTMIPITERSF
ncbi:hypothetical protein BT96DRAFT_189674 [Gymnopus androsaceus JB14]|uniref:Uncharacterized protein n=1 Tax=Gymnopus androsaceus JB14 TaxID=1447944 RepID=A0A6A4I886_9AGAR|nr:hypothetical protein BT96DRAFT_189674 [Gymnopus androsaceus JB14]